MARIEDSKTIEELKRALGNVRLHIEGDRQQLAHEALSLAYGLARVAEVEIRTLIFALNQWIAEKEG